MRIGILTFHRANNYGALLQCYALCRALCNLGHNAEVIDYRQPVIEKSYSKVGLKDFNPLRPVRFLKSLFLPYDSIARQPLKFHGEIVRMLT